MEIVKFGDASLNVILLITDKILQDCVWQVAQLTLLLLSLRIIFVLLDVLILPLATLLIQPITYVLKLLVVLLLQL